MKIPVLPNRLALAKLFGEIGFVYGAEIGVCKGKYSLVLCQNIPDLKLICVDPWTANRNHRDPVKQEQAYQHCLEILSPYGAKLMRMTSMEAAKEIEDESLDFVYIDALHDCWNVLQDLKAWVPKVRPDGIVAGHDWTHLGVTRALKMFLDPYPDIMIHSTKPAEEDWFPSWFWIKPDYV